MADNEELSDIEVRRQLYARFLELKSGTSQLKKKRDALENRLSELNKIVDMLIAEKEGTKYEPDSKTVNVPLFPRDEDNVKDDAAAPDWDKPPSEAFTRQLDYLLKKMELKTKEILDLIDPPTPQFGQSLK